MPKNQYRVSEKRAKAVFDVLIAHMRAEEYPFDHAEVPQEDHYMPVNLPRGGKRHGMFLWCTCYYMRGGIDSIVAFQRLTLMFERKPYLFNPGWFRRKFRNEECLKMKYGDELKEALALHPTYIELRKELNAHGLGFSLEENTRAWILNAIKMARFWKGDPRELFAGTTSYDVLIERIANIKKFSLDAPNGFIGFQHKMVSMIAYFLGDAKLVDLSVIPVPVDFHVLRMLVSTGIIRPAWDAGDGNLFSQELLSIAREVTRSYCDTHGVDMITLCNSLWLFSREMCSWHPDNESKVPDKTEKRKVQQQLRTKRKIEIDRGQNANLAEKVTDPNPGLGRRSRVIHAKPVWNDSEIRRYERSCSMCPVSKFCRLAIPSATYYLAGKLVRRRRSRPSKDALKSLWCIREHKLVKINPRAWDKEGMRKMIAGFLAGRKKPAEIHLELDLTYGKLVPNDELLEMAL